MSDGRRIVMPGDNVPIVGQNTYLVCKGGHVNEAPTHPNMQFRESDGTMHVVALCGRCMFDYNAMMFGGQVLPRETTKREAEWAAKSAKKGHLRANGLQCCDLAVMHEGDCEEETGKTDAEKTS